MHGLQLYLNQTSNDPSKQIEINLAYFINSDLSRGFAIRYVDG